MPNEPEEKVDQPLPYQVEDLTARSHMRFPMGEVSDFGEYYMRPDGKKYSYLGRAPQVAKFTTIFEDINRFDSATGVSGAISFVGNGNRIQSGGLAAGFADLFLPLGDLTTPTIPAFEETAFNSAFIISDIGGGAAGDDGAFYIGVEDNAGTFNGTTLSLTGSHQYGFKAIKDEGVVTLYATSGNVVEGEKTTLVGTLIESEFLFLAAVCESPNEVRFRVKSATIDFTSKHITNIPSATKLTPYCGRIFVTNLNTADEFQLAIGEYNFEKFSGALY